MWVALVSDVTKPVPYSVTAAWGWSAPSGPPAVAPSAAAGPSNAEPCSRFISTRVWVAEPLDSDSWKLTTA